MGPVKRAHEEEEGGGGSVNLVSYKRVKREQLEDCDRKWNVCTKDVDGPRRTSSLQSPIMLLSGHQDAVYTLEFNPEGTLIASGSHDKQIFLWNVYGECENCMVLKGHKRAVLDLHWTPAGGSHIISASADRTVRAWDVERGKQVKKMEEHCASVNCCCPWSRGAALVASGSDDGTAKLWDMRCRWAVETFPHKYSVTGVAMWDASYKLYTGGIENVVEVWDIRKKEVNTVLDGHTDTITGMQLSPDASSLLTNSMDSSLRIWDLRGHTSAPYNRCLKTLTGHQHNFEKKLKIFEF